MAKSSASVRKDLMSVVLKTETNLHVGQPQHFQSKEGTSFIKQKQKQNPKPSEFLQSKKQVFSHCAGVK
ncbi:hypothetical protein VULLAG_LOCUS4843 [Vulpes lagopus]